MMHSPGRGSESTGGKETHQGSPSVVVRSFGCHCDLAVVHLSCEIGIVDVIFMD